MLQLVKVPTTLTQDIEIVSKHNFWCKLSIRKEHKDIRNVLGVKNWPDGDSKNVLISLACGVARSTCAGGPVSRFTSFN